MKAAEFLHRHHVLASFPIGHKLPTAPIDSIRFNGGVATFEDVVDMNGNGVTDCHNDYWGHVTSTEPSLPGYAALKHEASQQGTEIWTERDHPGLSLRFPTQEYRMTYIKGRGANIGGYFGFDAPRQLPGTAVSLNAWLDDMAASKQGWVGAQWAINFDSNTIDIVKLKS